MSLTPEYSSIEPFVVLLWNPVLLQPLARSHSKTCRLKCRKLKIMKSFWFEFADVHAPETQHRKARHLELCLQSNMRRTTVLRTEMTSKIYQFNQLLYCEKENDICTTKDTTGLFGLEFQRPKEPLHRKCAILDIKERQPRNHFIIIVLSWQRPIWPMS